MSSSSNNVVHQHFGTIKRITHPNVTYSFKTDETTKTYRVIDVSNLFTLNDTRSRTYLTFTACNSIDDNLNDCMIIIKNDPKAHITVDGKIVTEVATSYSMEPIGNKLYFGLSVGNDNVTFSITTNGKLVFEHEGSVMSINYN